MTAPALLLCASILLTAGRAQPGLHFGLRLRLGLLSARRLLGWLVHKPLWTWSRVVGFGWGRIVTLLQCHHLGPWIASRGNQCCSRSKWSSSPGACRRNVRLTNTRSRRSSSSGRAHIRKGPASIGYSTDQIGRGGSGGGSGADHQVPSLVHGCEGIARGLHSLEERSVAHTAGFLQGRNWIDDRIECLHTGRLQRLVALSPQLFRH
mmetsp:Transcript_41183/g.98810  ORF Transcript_41183/g.98810 Transcript_41183/m.98810 type:complete len:207 (-) Transcript_41183:153-773(-)